MRHKGIVDPNLLPVLWLTSWLLWNAKMTESNTDQLILDSSLSYQLVTEIPGTSQGEWSTMFIHSELISSTSLTSLLITTVEQTMIVNSTQHPEESPPYSSDLQSSQIDLDSYHIQPTSSSSWGAGKTETTAELYSEYRTIEPTQDASLSPTASMSDYEISNITQTIYNAYSTLSDEYLSSIPVLPSSSSLILLSSLSTIEATGTSQNAENSSILLLSSSHFPLLTMTSWQPSQHSSIISSSMPYRQSTSIVSSLVASDNQHLPIISTDISPDYVVPQTVLSTNVLPSSAFYPESSSSIVTSGGEKVTEGPSIPPTLSHTTPPGGEDTESGLSTPAIVGITLGVMAFVIIIAVLLKCYRGRWQKNQGEPSPGDKESQESSGTHYTGIWEDMSVGYVNTHFDTFKVSTEPQEEMMSLDDDAYLNSLEGMVFYNNWGNGKPNTKF